MNSGLKEAWEKMILQVLWLIYEQDDTYLGLSFEESRPLIEKNTSFQEFQRVVTEELPHANANQMDSVCNSARTACVCLCGLGADV